MARLSIQTVGANLKLVVRVEEPSIAGQGGTPELATARLVGVDEELDRLVLVDVLFPVIVVLGVVVLDEPELDDVVPERPVSDGAGPEEDGSEVAGSASDAPVTDDVVSGARAVSGEFGVLLPVFEESSVAVVGSVPDAVPSGALDSETDAASVDAEPGSFTATLMLSVR